MDTAVFHSISGRACLKLTFNSLENMTVNAAILYRAASVSVISKTRLEIWQQYPYTTFLLSLVFCW